MRSHLVIALLLVLSMGTTSGCVGVEGGPTSSASAGPSSPPETPPETPPQIHHDPPVVVMLGDSITWLANDWQARIGLPDVRILNMGASGRRSDTLLPQAAAAMAAKPEMLFLMVGVNDVSDGIPHDRTVTNYAVLLDTMRSIYPYTVICCQSILPTSRPDWNASIIRLNDSIKTVAAGRGCLFIDLYPSYLDDDESRIRQELTVDGVHLTEGGYGIWADALAGCIPY
jgi:lysophospholipase L1-like esterase